MKGGRKAHRAGASYALEALGDERGARHGVPHAPQLRTDAVRHHGVAGPHQHLGELLLEEHLEVQRRLAGPLRLARVIASAF